VAERFATLPKKDNKHPRGGALDELAFSPLLSFNTQESIYKNKKML